MSLNNTPRANRLHIGLYGKRNSGKSSLINALTHQDIALVSPEPGTTTDPVYKSMEINGIGPCVFIDTAGFDDTGSLGALRVDKTLSACEKTDIALLIFTTLALDEETVWVNRFKKQNIPFIPIINKSDTLENIEVLTEAVTTLCQIPPLLVSATTGSGLKTIHEAIIRLLPEDFAALSITGELAPQGSLVLLVMPQDIQAPKGRLILPQVQTLRDLLDKQCLVMSCTTLQLPDALASLSKSPDLIITDSQVFKTVYDLKPKESKLTSFSALFAGYKGDTAVFKAGAYAIDTLTEHSKVLIAEACTHAPLSEDIGREKLPRMLRSRIGQNLTIDVVSGTDFPSDLSSYDLILHCGACMFNRQYVLSRIRRATEANVPISNYGLAIAFLSGILEEIDF